MMKSSRRYEAAAVVPKPVRQSGVLAYRKTDAGAVEILLLKKPQSKNWGIPKGKSGKHLSLAENAAKEAYEEAGIRGHVRRHPSGTYRAFKRVEDQQVLIEVWVFLMDVTSEDRDFPERARRELKWVPAAEAGPLLREPLLVGLCQDLARR